jgi:hypothetical protein
VAGAAALVRQAFPEFTPDEIAAFFRERSIDLGPAGPDNAFGVGRLNLGEAPTTPIELTEATAPPPAEKAEPTPEEPAPTPVAELEPTSTPRPAPEEPAIGLPGETGAGGEPGQPGAPPPGEEDNLNIVIGLGLCLICLAGLLLVVLVVFGVVLMRRR